MYGTVELKFSFSRKWQHRISPYLREGREENFQTSVCCLTPSIQEHLQTRTCPISLVPQVRSEVPESTETEQATYKDEKGVFK